MHMSNGRTADGEVFLQVRSNAATEVKTYMANSEPSTPILYMCLCPFPNIRRALTMTLIPPYTVETYAQRKTNLTPHQETSKSM